MTTEITREALRALTIEDINGMNKNALVEHLTAAVQFMNTQPERGPGGEYADAGALRLTLTRSRHIPRTRPNRAPMPAR